MHDHNQKDETLVLLTLAGDQTAYERLVVKYQSAVISAAASVTRSHFMAEDAAQDAFVTAWMKLNTLQEPAKFGAWVCRIAKNCALNTVTRMREFMPLETVDNLNVSEEQSQNPAELYAITEDADELQKSIGKLPDKIRTIVQLHYFEGLSIADIAERMKVSVGTVKWQLHDGRKRIRKELCAMNEKWNDTLVEKVMKKVEELKLWQLRNNKDGFEVIYRDVLAQVEDLPESSNKYHAMADVLMRGWWWLPGDKNDALFARIKEAAELGKNEEVMEFIIAREDAQVYNDAKANFVRDKQIPYLEQKGFVKVLAREYFWLGVYLFQRKNADEANAAFDKVRELLTPADIYYALTPLAREIAEKSASEEYKDKSRKSFYMNASAHKLRYIDGKLCYWKTNFNGEGWMQSIDGWIPDIIRNASYCDKKFFADIAVGETHVGSDGTTLTFESDNETVVTPAGIFEGCQLWTVKYSHKQGRSAFKSYYKDGVGIVKHEHTLGGLTEARLLKSYNIAGGRGLFPIAMGNTWEYASEYAPEHVTTELKLTVTFEDGDSVIITRTDSAERLSYDDNSWLDMIQQIRNDYFDGDEVCDVSHAIERAEALAETPMQKAHTKAACSVARRIMETHSENRTATGHWNFFERGVVLNKKGEITLYRDPRWSFELKDMGEFGNAETPLLCNDVYDILQDATKCLWSEEWRVGATPTVEYVGNGAKIISTQIVCEDGGTVTTKAGSFEDCLKISLDIKGMADGWAYRGGKKVYYFAPGIGIVRTVSEYCGGALQAVYELTEYVGTGEGYMPFADGMMRRYDALDLTDGFESSAVYTYVADDDGNIVVFTDRTGIRNIPAPTTQYASIQGEVIENQLWDQDKRKESHAKHAANNFHLMLHYIARPSHNRGNAPRSVELSKFKMNLIESFGNGNGVPDAWVGVYAWFCLVRAAAHFGKKEFEEGYNHLELALTYFEKWDTFKEGDLLDIGNEFVFGGCKFVRGKCCLLYPDGSREPVAYENTIDIYADMPYYVLSARRGWEWFNKVRDEERFKDYLKRAQKLVK